MSTVPLELAHAKLTTRLEVVGRREDGYHLLSAEMVSIDLADELEFGSGDGLEVIDAVVWKGAGGDGAAASSVPSDATNLVSRALRLVGRRARVRLTKHIPAGAGLGGGSSDAAAVLRWAGLRDPLVAARLGADVPFCLRGGRAEVTGVGERLRPLAFEARSYVLVTPELEVSTAAVYRAFDEVGPGQRRQGTANDLEAAALAVEPRLAAWRDLVGEVAGRPARLAGSGSTWYVECAKQEADKLVAELEGALGAIGARASIARCQSVRERDDAR